MHGVEVEIKVVKRKGDPLNDDESTNPIEVCSMAATTPTSKATTSLSNPMVCPHQQQEEQQQQQRSNNSYKSNGKLLNNISACDNCCTKSSSNSNLSCKGKFESMDIFSKNKKKYNSNQVWSLESIH